MKKLTSITIILMIPTLVASIYGMNVFNFLENKWWAFPSVLVFSALMAYMGIFIFKRKQWF